MKDKYMKFLKKQIVFLLILLVVVCFSFGVSYSNFIFNSPEQRAVEMINTKLEYKININGLETTEYNLVPGNNLLNIEIKSLNEIDTYYKLVYMSGTYDVIYYNTEVNNRISSNDTIILSVLVFNKLDFNQTITFDVLGGFITNRVSDIKVKEGLNEIEKNINIGDIVNINGNDFYLLEVKSDSIDLVSVNTYEKEDLSFVGALGYNNYVVGLNIFASNINLGNNLTVRTVNLEDIETYTSPNVIAYDGVKKFYKPSNNIYYPSLLEYEKDVKIDDRKEGLITRSQTVGVDGIFGTAKEITIKMFNINNINFTNNIYNNIFLNKNYYVSTRVPEVNDDKINYNVCKIENNNLKLVTIYDSDNNEYELNTPVKLFVNLESKYNIINNLIQI